MADPLSIIGAVASILQISSMVVKLVKAAKGAPADRQRLLIEINATTALCQTLRDYAEMNPDSWIETLRVLSQNDISPLDNFRQSLEYLLGKLTSESKEGHTPQAWMQNLKWPFRKSELLESIANIERQKSLLNIALTNDNLRLSTTIRDETQRIRRELEAVHLSQKEQEHDTRLIANSVELLRLCQENEAHSSYRRESLERKQALIGQLTTIDFQATHTDISSRRAPGTGQWLLDCPAYVKWRSNQSSSVIWCRGSPGAGKTVLASLVVDNLRELQLLKGSSDRSRYSSGVAGIYCSYKSSQTTKDLLGSLLHQLLPLSSIPDSYQPPTTLVDISKSLSEVLKEYQTTFIIVDGLDELPNRLGLLKELRQLLQSTETAASSFLLHILVTGRESVAAEIDRELKPGERLQLCSSEADVRSYLQQSLRTQGQLSEWINDDPKFGDQIIGAIIPKVNGMFLLARLYMDLLADIPTKRGVRRILDRLPAGVDNTYNEAWTRISAQKPQQCKLGKKILSWIIHATRSLRVSEIREALAVEEGDEIFDPDGLLDAAQLTSFCAGLVIINEQRQIVTLVHPTTQEYFNTRKATLFPAAHEDIATTCITYLCMKPFRDEGPLWHSEALDRRRRLCPLLRYAAMNWGWHVQQGRSMRILNLALSLLRDKLARQAACQEVYLNIIGMQAWGSEWPEDPFDHTKLLGWEEVGGTLSEIREAGGSLRSAHATAFFGLIDAAEILLHESAKFDDFESFHATPLHWVLLGRQDKMLEYLLDKGADRNLQRDGFSHKEWTLPLTIYAFKEVAVEALVKYGANIDKEDNTIGFGTAASVARYRKKYKLVTVLLADRLNEIKNTYAMLHNARRAARDLLRGPI